MNVAIKILNLILIGITYKAVVCRRSITACRAVGIAALGYTFSEETAINSTVGTGRVGLPYCREEYSTIVI